jgi:hypothetical protein
MRTDFAHLLHLFGLRCHYEPTARNYQSFRDFIDSCRGRLALQPSVLLVESRRTRTDATGGNIRRHCRNNCGVGKSG